MKTILKLLTTSLIVALTLISPQTSHGMDKSIVDYRIPKPLMAMILANASRHTKPGILRLVCKDWQETVDGKKIEITKNGTKYADIGPVWKRCVNAWYGMTGHEEVLKIFLNGKLIYRPTKGSDEGMIEFKISDLKNPFEWTFDLSKCGDAGEYLSISTGYRKRKIDANKDKVEVWFAPRFLIEKFLNGSARHFQPIMKNWNETISPMGIFYTWGNWDNLGWFDYLTSPSLESLSSKNLYANWNIAVGPHNKPMSFVYSNHLTMIRRSQNFVFIL